MTSDVVKTSIGYSNAAFKYSWLLAVYTIRARLKLCHANILPKDSPTNTRLLILATSRCVIGYAWTEVQPKKS
jgi:hypothetical protein